MGIIPKMGFIIENLRLQDLVAIVRQNQKFYEDFCVYLKQHGYQDVHDFINEPSDAKATTAIKNYLARQSEAQLLDGLARPYKDATAKWYFLAWMLRDAPAQRLQPLLTSVQGESLDEKRANLLNQLRKFVGPLFPQAASWSWPALSEVMLARLEGSRRALKGTKFEELVRGTFRKVFERRSVRLEIGVG